VSQRIFRLEAGPHERRNCPVSVELEVPAGQAVRRLWEVEREREVGFQISPRPTGRVRVTWVLDRLDQGQSRRYGLELGAGEPPTFGGGVQLRDNGEQVEITLNDTLLTCYHYAPTYARPFFWPLIGPYGAPITRAYPMQELPEEKHDHPHHRSLWVAHGDVNGVDNWSEGEGHGRTVHRGFAVLESGPVYGRFVADNDWVSAAGEKVVSERREVTVYNLPAAGRLLDFDLTFTATEGDVRFGDTKEGGILSVRVATSMDVPQGRITNAYGGIDEPETWGKRAHWCDYSGPVEGNWVGIAVFDHPTSFRYPTYWHVRNYGLMTANPFGLSYFSGDPTVDGSHVLPAGERLHFAYRLYLHSGDAMEGRVAQKYHDYLAPPRITWEGE